LAKVSSTVFFITQTGAQARERRDGAENGRHRLAPARRLRDGRRGMKKTGDETEPPVLARRYARHPASNSRARGKDSIRLAAFPIPIPIPIPDPDPEFRIPG
jgi:hypothetical protein